MTLPGADKVTRLARRLPTWAVWLIGLTPVIWLAWLVDLGRSRPRPSQDAGTILGGMGAALPAGVACHISAAARWGEPAEASPRSGAFGLYLWLPAFHGLDMARHGPALVADNVADLTKRPYLLLGLGALDRDVALGADLIKRGDPQNGSTRLESPAPACLCRAWQWAHYIL